MAIVDEKRTTEPRRAQRRKHGEKRDEIVKIVSVFFLCALCDSVVRLCFHSLLGSLLVVDGFSIPTSVKGEFPLPRFAFSP